MPVMTVETNVAFDMDGNPLKPASSPRRAPHRSQPPFGSCELVFTKADPKMQPPPAIKPPKAEGKFGSHESLPSPAANPRLQRLQRTQSEQVDGDEQAGKPQAGANRWGMLQAKTVGQAQAKKDKRRAQIVAAVTRRLFSVKKKSEDVPEPPEVPEQEDGDQEPEELKICSRARATLQELTKKAMVGRRIRRSCEAVTQTDFCERVVRVKEVAVETDETICQYRGGGGGEANRSKSIAIQCSRIASVMDEVYRRWSYHCRNGQQQARPWHYWPDSVFVTQHRFIAANEEDFSDDSLDSNHEVDGKLQAVEIEKPCVWKVLTITSGQRFATVIPDGSKSDFKVSPCMKIPANKEIEERSPSAVVRPDEMKTAPVSAESVDESGKEACCCRDSIEALHAIIGNLQQSLQEVNKRTESSCFIQLCSGECVSRAADGESKATQTLGGGTVSTATQCNEPRNDGPPHATAAGRLCSCGLCRSHQKIKSFVYRWKSKCRLPDGDDVQFTVPSQSQFFVSANETESEPKANPPQLRLSGLSNKIDDLSPPFIEPLTAESVPTHKFPINFIEVPFPCDKTCGVPIIVKPTCSASNEASLNNNNNTKCAESHPPRNWGGLQQCYFPVLVNNNGQTSVIGFVKNQDQHQFLLPVLSNCDSNISEPLKDKKHNQESVCPARNLEKDTTDLFTDESDVSLRCSLPYLTELSVAEEAADSIKQRIDAEKQHWLEIKSMILGHAYNALPSATEQLRQLGTRCKASVAKKRVTWKDYRGCGDLVQIRSVPSRDQGPLQDSSLNEVPDDAKHLYRTFDREWRNIAREENVSHNNISSINVTIYPFLRSELKCDLHDRKYGSKIYLIDSKNNDKPRFLKQAFKPFDRNNLETLGRQKGRIMNTLLSRSKYYEEKLAQLSLLRERRQKGQQTIGQAGFKRADQLLNYDKSNYHTSFEVNCTNSTLNHFLIRRSKSTERQFKKSAGWKINVNLTDRDEQTDNENPCQIQNRLSFYSNLLNSNCEQSRTSAESCLNARNFREGVYYLSPDCSCNHGSTEMPVVPFPSEINKNNESRDLLGHRRVKQDCDNSETRQKCNIASPSKYLKHLLSIRRQIVGSFMD